MRKLLLSSLAAALLLAANAGTADAFTLFNFTNQQVGPGGLQQLGRLSTTATAGTCAGNKATPSLLNGSNYYVTQRVVTNYNNTPACLTFTLTPACSPAAAMFSVLYADRYLPGSPTSGYRSDGGTAGTGAQTASASLARGQSIAWAVGTSAATTACSSFTQTVTSTVPVAVTQPLVGGSQAEPAVATVGVSLHADVGYWPGTSNPTYSYNWMRCDADGTNCGQLAGGYSYAYTPTRDDEGHRLVVRVTATSGGVSSSADSAPSNVVAAGPPRPAVTAQVSSGHSLLPTTSLVPGSTGDDVLVPISLPFGVAVGGVTHHAAVASSNGNLQFVDDVADASNKWVNTCLPSAFLPNVLAVYWDDLTTDLSEDPGFGIRTGALGTAPHRRFVIEWRGAENDAAARPVVAQAVLYEDGSRMSVIYGASGDGGLSATVGFQPAQSPAYTTQVSCNGAGMIAAGTQIDYASSKPAVAGTARAGQTLSATGAAYAGLSPIATTLQWQLCNASGGACSAIAGATGPKYALPASAAGHTLRVRSAAANADGSAVTVSDPTPVVAAAPAAQSPSPSPSPSGRAAAPVLSHVSVRKRTLRFTSSAAGTARVVLARRTTGRKVRGHCVRRTAANRHRHSCTRWVTVRSLRVAARAGDNRVVLPRKALRRGRYRVQVRVVAGDHESKTVARSLAVR